MNTIERGNLFTSAIINSVKGLEGMSPGQQAKMGKALDVDNNGEVTYVPEYSSGHNFVNGNYTTSTQSGGTRLTPGVTAGQVVAGLRRRKEAIDGIASAFEDKTFDQARKAGSQALYFGGFFDPSVRTLKDEIRDVAHGLRTFGQLAKLAEIVEQAPRNAEGKITFDTWDRVLFGQLQVELGVRGMGRLLHGSQWGDL